MDRPVQRRLKKKRPETTRQVRKAEIENNEATAENVVAINEGIATFLHSVHYPVAGPVEYIQ